MVLMGDNGVCDEYDEKDLRTHVFDSPDTYAGSDEISPDRLPIINTQIFFGLSARRGARKISL